MTSRLPPHDLEAERSVLGSAFISPGVWPVISGLLATDDFFLPAHREIYDAMAATANREMPLDPVTVGAEIKARGALPRLEGGEEYLMRLTEVTPTSENATHYARIVLDTSKCRQIIQVCASAMSRAYGTFGNVDDFIEEHMGDVSRIVMRTADNKLTRLAECMPQVMNDIVRRVEIGPERAAAGRVTFGVRSLDELTVGLDPEDLVIIGGDPGSGKTALAVQAGLKLAIDDGGTCLCANLEMSRFAIGERALSHRARVNSFLLRTGRLSTNDMSDLYAAEATIRGGAHNNHIPADFYIEDGITTVQQFEAKARLWRARHPSQVAVGIFDFLQLADGEGAHQTRAQQVAADARRLKKLAGQLKITLIALSSLKRDSKEVAEKPPTMKSLKESGDVEYAATTILLIWDKDNRPEGQRDLIVAKNKKGPTATLPIWWTGRHYAYSDIEDAPDPQQPLLET